MIRPSVMGGAAFTTEADGDQLESGARGRVSRALGLASDWATLVQTHGATVRRVSVPGGRGEGDAMWTIVERLPLAVLTADCVGVVMEAEGAVGVAHAGWRGLVAGVVSCCVEDMTSGGFAPTRAAIGPSIGPCCYEVGEEVSGEFEAFASTTTWGTPSVDLAAAAAVQLGRVEVWRAGVCTSCGADVFSHRGDGTRSRMASIGWLP